MIKTLLHITFVCIATFSLAQNDDAKSSSWKKEKEYLKYEKAKDYKGPTHWSHDPSDLKEDYNPGSFGGSHGGTSRGGGVRYNPQQIRRDRVKRYGGFDRGGGSGTVKYDPRVKRPERKARQRPEPVQYRQGSRNRSSSGPWMSTGFGKTLLFILLFALIMVIAYFIIKNRKPSDKKLVVDVQNDWNPEVISKTELELKLEAAMANEDFRECVRIYFTFILKELIHKGWIRWKKEKTNHHYVIEMGGKPDIREFMECVRIYDLVWYGEYKIDREIFEMLQPSLNNYYKSLEPTNE